MSVAWVPDANLAGGNMAQQFQFPHGHVNFVNSIALLRWGAECVGREKKGQNRESNPGLSRYIALPLSHPAGLLEESPTPTERFMQVAPKRSHVYMYACPICGIPAPA